MVKYLLCLLLFSFNLLALESGYNPNNWVELSKIYVTKNSPVQEYNVMWMNTYSQPLYPCQQNYPFPGDWSEADRWMERYGWMGKSYPDCEWITVCVADRIPKEAKAIYLTGLLIITTGNNQESPSMTIAFRRKGEEKEYRYSHQTSVATRPGTARSTMSVWLPLSESLEFEFKWTRTTFGHYPDNSAYGISLSLNAWAE
jgi:hypothetical protein